MAAPVVLLTDFGESEYAGVLRGVVMSLAPKAKVVDLTHRVTAQSVREGAWLLAQNYKWFPAGSVFLCVVDPGVGTARAAIAVRTRRYAFVGPDNGLLAPAAHDDGVQEIVRLETPRTASHTFHGRDVFAPAAARLAAGAKVSELGVKVESMQPLEFHLNGREGEIVRIDPYGNCITNVPAVPGVTRYRARITAGSLPETLPCYSNYQEAGEDELFAIESSYHTLELAVRNGSAQARIGTRVGARILLKPVPRLEDLRHRQHGKG